MAKLSEKTASGIQDLIQQSGDEYNNDNIPGAVKCLLDAWNLLPAPPTKYDDSYHLASYLIRMYVLQNDYESATQWAETLQACDLERFDDGERELIAGKVAYDSGDQEKAGKYFRISFKKSEGRSFDEEDPKYLQLLTA